MPARDSKLWWLALAVVIVGYLQTVDPIPAWGYQQWLQFASVILAWATGKVSWSPLSKATGRDV